MNKILLVILLIVFYACDVQAEDLHTTITSGNVEVKDRGDFMLFSFNNGVHVSSEGFDLTSDNLEIFSERFDDFLESGICRPSVKKIYATGNVKFVQCNRNGSADEIIIYPKKGIMTLFGNAIITDIDGTAHGDKLILDKNLRSLKVESKGRSSISIGDNSDFAQSLIKQKKEHPKNTIDD